MVDQDGKKPFIIPKTHTSNKDVLFSEKPESRNVKELFDEIKSCALEIHFDFRQNECKSCDTIRNPKLQKLFNERKIQMKKSQDQIERYAFHIISSRDMAMKIATDGLSCEQLTFSIDKYLGNPKDGIHLSRRPDVLLASTGSQNLQKFGLLICKILLGKGYPTVPATNNKELSAQLHCDHHFCKIQTSNKEQRNINDLLANSLVFCYEHNDMKTISYPSQILPLAILWYDLTEKFSTELISISKESQQRNVKPLQQVNSYVMKRTTTAPPSKPLLSRNTGTWDEPIQESSTMKTNETTPTKYSNHFIVPYSPLCTSFSSPQTSIKSHITETMPSFETIPLSPMEKSSSLSSSSSKQQSTEKIIPSKDIPLNSNNPSFDPRLQTLKQTHHVFYLENKAVKHALQQQKRLNQYYDTKNELIMKKTTYTLIPFVIHSIPLDRYEHQRPKPVCKEYSSLYVSVIDCFQLGLKRSDTQSYIDLEDHSNQSAYEQIQISNRLIKYEKQLNSQERRLHSREQRQRKLQEHLNERKKLELPDSRIYIDTGRKLLKEHQITSSASSNNHLSTDLLDFFSNEYRQETRPQVKRVLAELLGIFIEKYGTQNQTTDDVQILTTNTQTLNDHDERFPSEIPVPITSSSDLSESNQEKTQTESLSSEANLPQEDSSAKQTEVSIDEIPTMDDALIHSHQIIHSELLKTHDEFVPLATKEASISNLPSPPLPHQQSVVDDDNEEINIDTESSSTRTVTLICNDKEDNLIIKTTNTTEEKDEEEEEQPIVKRIKVDLISPPDEVLDTNARRVMIQDRDERRGRNENTDTTSLRSRSKSNSSYNSFMHNSRTRSPSSSSSTVSRNSLNRNDYQRQRRNEYDYKRNRSYERSYPYQQRNNNYNMTPSRHQRFNYNHQSVADHPRFTNNIDKIPSLFDNLDHESMGISNNSDYQNSSMTNFDQNRMSSYHNEPPSNQQYYQDNYINNLLQQQQPPPLMSTIPVFPNPVDPAESEAIGRLNMFLQGQKIIQQNLQSSYINNSQQDINNTQWPSLQYSSNTNQQNNQTFSSNDANQLLSLVRHFGN